MKSFLGNNTFNALVHISSSLCVSIIFIWIIGYFFCDSLIYYEYCPELNKFIHAPFVTHKQRSEGIASTRKGQFGVNAINNITNDRRKKIIIWGDSFVESHQVNDEDKIPQVITKKLVEINTNSHINSSIMSFGVGMSGDSVADYYFDIPEYEALTQPVEAHFIIITNINDILPDQSSDTKRGLFKSNPFRIYQDQWQPKFQRIKKILNNAGLYFIWQPVRASLSSLKEISFIPIPKKQKKNLKEIACSDSEEFMKSSWEFLFSRLKKQTSKPVIFVYCPDVPRIKKNTIIKEDTYKQQMKLFSEIADKYNISFLNLSGEFVNFYETTGLFPRGFANSKPSEGHFNRYGHEIVAEIITEYIRKTGNI
jgi:hypothetical protein